VQEHAYLTAIVAGIFYLFASARLIALSRRTRKRPELLLGVYFGCSGIYYAGANLPSLLGSEAWPDRIGLAIDWTYNVGVVPYLLFIRSAFRPNSAWAKLAVAACAGCLLAGGLLVSLLVGHVDFTLGSPGFLLQWIGYTFPCGWICAEALHARRGALKRARIGLCPPIVANRYLLLALFGAFQVIACLGDLSLANDLGERQVASQVSDLLVGGAEIASIATLGVALLPPYWYRDWIRRRARVLPTPMDG
jgi:hypothetical protein